jgi:hypothetical protein
MGVTTVLNLLRLVGEAAWLYPWGLALGTWLGGASQPLLGLPLLFVVILLAAVGTRSAVRARTHPKLARGVFVGLGALVACLVALSQVPVFSAGGDWADRWQLLSQGGYGGRAAIGAALVVFLWWRGITVGRSKPSSWNVEDEFRTGILAMAGLLVIVALAGEKAGVSSEPLVFSVITLILVGLVGMPLARVVDESERPRHADSPRLSPGGPWLTMLLGVVGAVLLTTLLLAQVFTFQRLGMLFEPLRGPLDAVLWGLIYVVALPMGLLASVVIYLWRLVVRPGGAPAQLQPTDMGWLNDLQRQSQGGAVAPELLLALKVGVVALLGLVLAAILVQAVRRFSDWWDNDEVEEIRGFLSSRPGIQELLQWLLHRLRPVRPIVLQGDRANATTAGPLQGVRGLYREFLSLGIEVGYGRRLPETPREYRGRLGQETLPGVGEVDLITESYNRARYAPSPSAPDDVGPVASALARLRILWRDRSQR